jgi:hypothetical protein
MKQGSADDPFADDTPEEDTSDTDEDTDSDDVKATTGTAETEPALSTSVSSGSKNRSLPYIHSRDGVKDGRTQRPVFLRDHIEEGIDDLVTQMEDEFGEDVYKTDITEAAMAVAQENPKLVREKLDEWGYGWA